MPKETTGEPASDGQSRNRSDVSGSKGSSRAGMEKKKKSIA